MDGAEAAPASLLETRQLTVNHKDNAAKQGRKAWIRALDAIRFLDENPAATLPSLCQQLALTHGDRPALIDAGGTLSYRGLAERANRTAHWALAQGLAAGDVVCVLMPNSADYVALWLGLTQAGCAAALINTDLTGTALAHCIAAAKPARLIVALALLPAVESISDKLPPGLIRFVHGGGADAPFPLIDQTIEHYPATPPELPPSRQPASRDTALLIFTSGTTGLPKAAKVTHGRILEWSFWFAGLIDASPGDRLYNCLPMYHSTGGIVAIGAMLVRGASVLIAQRFSASRFWDEVTDGQCTLFIYIGELCRYLARGPDHSRQRGHQLRLCFGNGLRGDVWELFQGRFAIPRILEFYAATEGNVSLYNCEGKAGAIGHVPAFLAHRFPIALVQCDAASGEIIRDAAGLCIPCAAGETGEAIGKIDAASHMPSRQFDGYSDAGAAARKTLANVFATGDLWFRTGDLMRKDSQGYYYFVDRIGDTFRWKGENVSSTEAGAVIGACPGVQEAVVFGVAVPGCEGRAGMAAITIDAGFSLELLQAHLQAHLPPYARPLFLRICSSVDLTGTFKLNKTRLKHEGFTPPTLADPVWFFERARSAFTVLDGQLRQQIATGQISQF